MSLPSDYQQLRSPSVYAAAIVWVGLRHGSRVRAAVHESVIALENPGGILSNAEASAEETVFRAGTGSPASSGIKYNMIQYEMSNPV